MQAADLYKIKIEQGTTVTGSGGIGWLLTDCRSQVWLQEGLGQYIYGDRAVRVAVEHLKLHAGSE